MANQVVDVLAVMDKSQQVLGEVYFKYQRQIGPFASQALASVHQLPPARAAVAELMEAAATVERNAVRCDGDDRMFDRLHAALVRCGVSA